jgi:hypothetical protein
MKRGFISTSTHTTTTNTLVEEEKRGCYIRVRDILGQVDGKVSLAVLVALALGYGL